MTPDDWKDRLNVAFKDLERAQRASPGTARDLDVIALFGYVRWLPAKGAWR